MASPFSGSFGSLPAVDTPNPARPYSPESDMTAARPLPMQTASSKLQAGESELDILEVLRRQMWLIAACVSAGFALATYYALHTTEWFESSARVLVMQRDSRAATGQYSESGTDATVSEETLADHMQLIRSRRIVEVAMNRPAPKYYASFSAGAAGDPVLLPPIELNIPVPQQTPRFDTPDIDAPGFAPPSADPIDVPDEPASPLPIGDPIDIDGARFDAPPATYPVAMQTGDPIDTADDSVLMLDVPAEADAESEDDEADDEPSEAFSEEWFNAPDETEKRPVLLRDLPSIQTQLKAGQDVVDYVIDRLNVSMGGEGAARSARSLNIAFEHPDPADAKLVLEAVVVEYQNFLDNQLRNAAEMIAGLASEKLDDTEQELRTLESKYVQLRKDAPLLYSSEGSNPYVDAYRTLQNSLLDIQVKESSIRTRLDKVLASLDRIEEADGTDLEKLALIDSDSLERLGMFAGLQMNAANSAEFVAAQPQRIAAARVQYEKLLEMQAELLKLERDLGANNPAVRDLQDQIALVKDVIDQSDTSVTQIWGDDVQLGPETLLLAYVGFLKHDLSTLDEQRRELTTLMAEAERNAKSLTEFELQEETMRATIDRKRASFDSVIEEIREIDSASAFSGFVHELLEAPRVGKLSWPKLPLCLVGGMLLGLIGGLLAALFNDRSDNRFRSASQVEQELGLSVLGRVGKLPATETDGSHLAATAIAPEGEAFRSIRTVLLPEVKNGRLKTLGLTSPISGDGKSTTMANLAASFAQAGQSILIVDADMRRPTVHKQLGISLGKGLSNVLRDQMTAGEAIHSTTVGGLSAMTAGSAVGNPAELLQGAEFAKLIDTLKSQFDLVVFDLGPVLAVSDPLIASQRLDGMLLVTRVSNDTVAQARDAVARLRASGGTLLGAVVNTFGAGREFGAGDGYYGYYGEYGSYSTAAREKEIAASEAEDKRVASEVASNGHAGNGQPSDDGRPKRRRSRRT